MEPTERRIPRGEHQIVAWSWQGLPPPILLMHGIGNYARYWDLFADAVDRRAALVAYDARGHGDSGKPVDAYDPSDFVADALAVLDVIAPARTVVVGHSMGGAHAIALAASHPERVSHLVIVDSSPEPLREGAERARRMSLERPERFSTPGEAMAYVRRTSPGYSEAVYENRSRWLFRRDVDGITWRSSGPALRAIMGETRRHGRMWDSLAAIRCPALVVRGTRSSVLGAEIARRMVDTLRSGRLLELDAGHNVPLDRPAELADAVVAFARA
jgi:pimeloyl-ACP methyl ester carboxylesterase